jgi:hypothetical protein
VLYYITRLISDLWLSLRLRSKPGGQIKHG